MLFNDKCCSSSSLSLNRFRLPRGILHQGYRPRHLWAGRPTFRTFRPLQFSTRLDGSLRIEFTRATVGRASRPTAFSTADSMKSLLRRASSSSLGSASPERGWPKRLVGSPCGAPTVALEGRACPRWGGGNLSTLLGQRVPQRVLVGPPGGGRSGACSLRLNAASNTRPALGRLGAPRCLSRLGPVSWPDFTPERRSAAHTRPGAAG